jgi:hypothetical protein
MVSEKVAVAAPVAAGILMGDSAVKVVKRYRKKVRANGAVCCVISRWRLPRPVFSLSFTPGDTGARSSS